MDAEVVLVAVAISFVAASNQSITGFGFALITAPLLSVAWEVKPAIAATLLLGLLVNTVLLVLARGSVSTARLPGLWAGFLVGVPLGLLFVGAVNTDVLQVAVGIVVLGATLVVYLQPSVDGGHDSLPLRLGAGAVSGVLSSATSMGGPPVVLYLLGRETEIDSYRATIQAYFLLSGVLTAIAFLIVGRINEDVLLVFAAGAPAVGGGVLFGGWLRRFLNVERFRRLVVGVLVVTSLSVITLAVLG